MDYFPSKDCNEVMLMFARSALPARVWLSSIATMPDPTLCSGSRLPSKSTIYSPLSGYASLVL